MKRISDRFLQLGVLAALTGMTLGVYMGATQNFTLSPVHAHINLLGWVSMVLYGLFYRAFPQAGQTKLAVVHFWVAVLGFLIMVPSLAAEILGHTEVAPVLGVASVVVLLSMAIFVVVVFKATSAKPATA
ncbi:cytochrome-c oxidase [Caulobacter sp. 17J80-11]|uniref:cytochrome-c oxidase n=1 Tax=Caulobacter sp. 17J80-11 TaxID=2763502 RepID=UPI0016538E2E|nr:cytochrome-c oxidase [Caulobacter sp. 17J80-11]MBC6983683.1 cytochrome-c oxidase [Caulobacter sp. 17J80-11]